MQHKSRFNERDLKYLNIYLSELNNEERIAIHLRYWQDYLIEEIAQVIRRSWSYTDKLIENAVYKLSQKFSQNITKTQLNVA